MPSVSFDNVRILVNDYPACFRFYRDTLGFEPTFGDEESGYGSFDADGATIALFDADEMADVVSPMDDERGRECTVVVLAVEDLDETVTTLKDRGVAFETAPTDREGWGIRTAYCRDPDGTLLELFEPLEE